MIDADRMNFGAGAVLLAAVTVLIAAVPAAAKQVAEWDFSKGTQGWTGNARVEGLTHSAEGLVVKSTGEDPWIEGPPVDLPGDKIIRVRLRMRSNADTGAELFYGRAFKAGDSVRFTVRNDGQWHDYSLVVRDRVGPGTRFRLDPCMDAGQVTVAFIRVEAIGGIIVPSPDRPEGPDRTGDECMSVKSGPLAFEHYGRRWGNSALKVGDVQMAAGYESGLLGLVFDEQPVWLNLKGARVKFDYRPEREQFRGTAVITDARGGKWKLSRRVRPGEREGTLLVEVELSVNQDRDIIHVPWLTIFPGLGTFGERKYQGLLAGLEYLCDEPSSSEADIATPDHIRRVPDPVKVTFPLMAISHGGNYVGVIWEPSDMIAATFDSPDRIYNSGAHVMSLSGPAVGELRFENDFSAHTPFRLEANKPLRVSMLIIGGEGKTVVPAVKSYVELKGLPAVPDFEGGFDAAVNLLAHGWLDSQINHDGLFRHAVWGESFGPGPAADAAMFIDWLSFHTEDGGLSERLNGAKRQALSKIAANQPFSSAVSHAHLPNAPLVFGRVPEFVQRRRNESLGLLGSFDANGTKLYRPGATDYSRTHFAKHANGLSGRDMVRILEGATLSGDEQLIRRALELLDTQTALYAGTVPRGAQTWEVPLHTPDILASAHMIKAYTLGYIISGKAEYLEQARYWAWTGVPFVYLYSPTSGRVGPYATIAVLGATNWKAPLWLGRPVQWCGLVYCSALHMLSECDPDGPWEKIARGITAAGLQMSWPLSDEDRQGLLPDFFDLTGQVSAGPAINPGTVQAHVAELYEKGKIYDVKKLPDRSWFIHAPCAISDINEDEGYVSFTAGGWDAVLGDRPYYVLISGLEKEPSRVGVRRAVEESGGLAFRPAEKQFYSEHKILVITLEGKSEVRIR